MTRRKRAALTAACILLGLPRWRPSSGPTGSPDRRGRSLFTAPRLRLCRRHPQGVRAANGHPDQRRYDSEATKSLGLVNQLKLEKDDPHCDVFWNNELLGTMDLASEGVLEPYKGTGYERIPAQYKDDAGRWTGFAARMRVWIVNQEKAPRGKVEVPTEVVGRIFEKIVERAAIANPLYGTTFTHFCLLWQRLGRVEIEVLVCRRSQTGNTHPGRQRAC